MAFAPWDVGAARLDVLGAGCGAHLRSRPRAGRTPTTCWSLRGGSALGGFGGRRAHRGGLTVTSGEGDPRGWAARRASKRLRHWQDLWRRGLGRGVFPHQLWWVLELPWRRVVLSPSRLVRQLPLRPDTVALELGPGSGYYSRHVATQLPAGRLILCDVQVEMLRRNQVRRGASTTGQVVCVAGDAAHLPFESASVDVVYMVTVFGEVRDQSGCLREIARVLGPAGTLAISEHLPDPDFCRFSALRRQVERAGFVFSTRNGPPWAYTAIFAVS
ncbi:class I SAM-dependent methyltransferase [Gemmatimonas sp. UBA7669]|uniref:class I SAM-dependent methyltransferase n=1 Tax=Gemmatimonas sp. UBA7669 TaxID=1946568 RepID=UPI0031B70C9A